MKRTENRTKNPHLLGVSIAAIAVTATFATAWAQKPPSKTGTGTSHATSASAKASARPSASAAASAAPSAAPSASASAPPSAAPSAAPSAPAASGAPLTGTPEELFRRGNEFAKVDKWADAEPLYRAAWDQKKSYDIAGNLGLAEFQQKKWRDAAEHLSFAVKSFPASGKSANRELLENILAQVKAEVSAVKLTVSVMGADVIVDGKKVGVSPLSDTLFVDPGSRKIEAVLSGYDTAQTTVTAQKGKEQEVTLTLTQKQAPIAAPTAPGWRPKPPILIAGGAVGALGVVGGAVFTVLANGKATNAEGLRGKLSGTSACASPASADAATCADLKSDLQSQGTFSNVAVASFVVGGVFGLGTAGLAVWSILSPAAPPKGDAAPAKTAAATARVVPVIDGQTRGVSIVGRW